MKLIGSLTIDDLRVFLVLHDLKGSQRWYLFSEIRLDQLANPKGVKLEDYLDLNKLSNSKFDSIPYLLEAQSRSKKTGVVSMYKSSRRLDKILRALNNAKSLSYPKSSILEDKDYFSPVRVRIFSASYMDNSISMVQEDGLFTSLSFSSGGIKVQMMEDNDIKIPRGLSYQTCPKVESNSISEVSINQISPEALNNIVDLSWYRDPNTGEIKKDYTSIDNVTDFEVKLITPLVYYISGRTCTDKFPLVSCDTETSGLLICDLTEGNPDKDHITTIQFSWKDDQGVIVYLDMEYFNNVPLEYAFSRLAPLFVYRLPEEQEFDYELLYDLDGNEKKEVIHLNRKKYKLVGHHSSFDSKVTKSVGADLKRRSDGKFDKGWDTQFFFDHDTLQMVFNIDPTTVKRNKGLKKLTRFFFNEETPELSDILGKGNEGRFKILRNREITRIYGCADTDYTRKCFKPLRELTTDKMYKSYKQLDPISWYLTGGSEYYGLPLDKSLVSRNAKIIKEDLNTIKELIYSYVGSVLFTRTKLKTTKHENLNLNDEEDLDISNKFYSDKKYVFNIGGQDLKKVMYNMLHYPVMSRSKATGAPSVDSYAIDKLLKQKLSTSSNVLPNDVYSVSIKYIKDLEKPEVLISKDKFNSYVYPLCYLLKEYKKLDKEYSTYYAPFDKEDLEGRLYKSISTTNIETRRFSCPSQIIKASLKKAVVSISPDHYLAGWDLAQAEPRTFTSLSGDLLGIEKLNDYEKDYHTENASEMYGIPAYQVDSASRKKAKVPGLGIPYGLKDRKLCERLGMEPNPENLRTTRLVRSKFETAKHYEMDFLNSVRNGALNVVDVPVALKRLWGVSDDAKIGMVKNENGFYRYFDLTYVLGDEYLEDTVRRASGNYPIQSFQADFYRFLIRRFHEALIRYGIRDKVIFHMYIHDELLFSVHKSVDPRLIAKIVTEACMVKLKGHTTYFAGLSFGDNWLETHSGDFEIPVGLMYQIRDNFDSFNLREWTDKPNDLIMPMIKDYERKRFLEVVHEMEPNYETEGLSIDYLLNHFKNYTVRSYVYNYKPCYSLKQKYSSKKDGYDDDPDDDFISRLCSLFVDSGLGDLKLIQSDGSKISINDYVNSRPKDPKDESLMELSDDNDDLFYSDFGDDDGFYTFDNEDLSEHVEAMYVDRDDNEDDCLTFSEPDYKFISKGNKCLTLKVKRLNYFKEVQSFAKDFRSNSGNKVIVESNIGTKILPGKYDMPLDKLDNLLAKLN